VYFTLDDTLKNHFTPDQNLFDEMMSLQGHVYRELENRRTQSVVLNGETYFIKQHFGIGWKEIFKNLAQLRLPVLGAGNEWRAISRLTELGVPTQRLAGYGSKGVNPARKHSFLLTHALTDTISLEDYCLSWLTTPPPVTIKRALILEVARIARILHQNGINHRDFYICHFLLAKDTEKSGQPLLYLIDLHRAQLRKKTPARWLIKDLAGLYFSSKEIGLTSRDVLRFISAYTNKPWRDVLTGERIFWEKVKQRGDKTYQDHGK
jgi:heptose I phosphotransferase